MSQRRKRPREEDVDVSQDRKAELRDILRSRDKDVKARKAEIIDVHTTDYGCILAEGRALHPEIEFQKDGVLAVMDATHVNQMAGLGVQQGKKVEQALVQFFTPDQIINSLVEHYSTYSNDEDQTDARLEWSKIGKLGRRYLRCAPSMHFLNGPMSTEYEAKERKQKEKSKKKPVGEAAKPKLVDQSKEEKTMTDGRVKKIVQILEKSKWDHKCMFKFAINPNSFTESIENLYDMSFLVKQGSIELAVQDGRPFVRKTSLPSPDNWDEGLVSGQCIMAMNKTQWLEIIRAYKITESYLPTRTEQANQDEEEALDEE